MRLVWLGVMIMALATESGRTSAFLEVKDWRKAREKGWTFGDQQVSAQGRVLRVTAGMSPSSKQDGESKEVVYPHALAVSARFAVVLKARFLKIGQDDDSTGPKSNLRLLLGTKSSHGDFGLAFAFTADRYKVDGQYKIFRTDDAWHEWRFEVDTQKKTVAMLRDGDYVCLHKAGAPQEPGVRIQVQGSKDVPAVIEVADLRVLPLKGEIRKLGNGGNSISQFPDFPISPGEWLTWRRDVRNTGFSPLKGNIREPRVAYHYRVGGPAVSAVFEDIDGDGQKEALVSHGGNFSALRLDGSLLWRQRMENAIIYGAFDLDGDGERELLISAGVPSQVHVLRARDGKVLYNCGQFPKAGVAGVRVAKLAPKKKGLQAVVWSPQHEIGFCLSFAEGVENAKVDWTFDWKVTNFSPEVALADMDCNGLLEVVVVTYDHVFVFDGRSGERKMELTWSGGRNYGTLVVKDIDGDGYPDVVMLADQLREHVAVIKNEAGRSLRLLWDKFYEQNYPEDKKSLRVLTESVDDFDGDGRTEVAYALYDGTADAKWHTLVVDALSGTVKEDLPGYYLVGAGALFPGLPPALLLSKPSNRTDLSLNQISVWSGRNEKWREQVALPEGNLLAWQSFRDFDLSAWSLSLAPTTVMRRPHGSMLPLGLFLVRAEGGSNSVEFLSGNEAGRIEPRWRCQLPKELPSGTVVGVEKVMGMDEAQTIFVGADGLLRVIGAEGKALGELRTGGFIAAPIVARLRQDDAPSILFIDVHKSLHCLRAPEGGGTPQLLWSQLAIGSRIRYVPHLETVGVPVVGDMDGDGEKEILVAQTPNKLVALDPDGKVKRSWEFPSLPVQWTYGNFDGDEVLDLFVTYQTGTFVDVESIAIAGKSGKRLWQSHCGNGPVAVYDVDGDGLDDVILRDLFEHRTLSGRTGRDVYPITQWAGYHAPVVALLNGATQPPGVVWVGGSYSLVVETLAGDQRWWKPFRATGPQGVADVDGDGRVEVGGVTAGQLYNWPDFYAVDGPDKEFLCYDALTGTVRWSLPLGVTASGVVAADLDGDGRAEFLLGTADGRLIALRGGKDVAERKLWELNFPAALGAPVVCDADGDGLMEVLVGCADGNLYCVR